ncbi:MAG TPA: nucleotide sugar dehydrogenase [Solirubrobacteraceae bacterium]|nr:nucleotide sugar dehydrogenase [Solirubrobacteraceae bacterium]
MTIGIVGLGYVGLPLAVEFAEAGQRVVGIDTNQTRVNQLRAGESYIEDIPSERLQAVASRIEATTRTSRLAQCDAIIVAVPTPLTANREPDLAPLISAAQSVADALQPGQLVILESTTYPGTTRERVLPILEETGLVAGRDFHLAFSPERVDPGNETYSLHNTPKILGGLTPACRNRAEAVYGLVCEQVVPVSTLEVSEMAKLLENIFRSVNIALVNELARLADRMHIDIHEVIDAAATKPFGFMRFDPGPGMGGHCLPVDPFYLSWKARELDFATEFIELAGKVNQTQPYFCVEQAERALNEQGKAVKGSKIAVLGVAYKPGVGDIRESPALKIIDRLQVLGADVSYHDPYVPELKQFELQNTDLEQALAGADVALIVTAHPGIDHNHIAASVPTVDFRGVTRTQRAVARPPAEMPVPRAEQTQQPMEVAA